MMSANNLEEASYLMEHLLNMLVTRVSDIFYIFLKIN